MRARVAFPSVQWMIAIVLVADAAVLGAIAVVTRTRADAGPRPALAGRPAPPPALDGGTPLLDPGWAMCFHDKQDVSRVAITYLDTGVDAGLTVPELLRWFGSLPYDAIEVWKLEHKGGTRRVAFELDWTRWPRPPGWDEVTRGWSGDELCSALRHDLVGRGVGRPRAAAVPGASDAFIRSRHDFEFFDQRREDRYAVRIPVGTLADVVATDRLPDLLRWVEPTTPAPATPGAPRTP
ncbi:MAG: hypothetical protein HS111_30210 [Kofleriaceae bacterium]|nr:hypothetical protein [Kofleriaceae bacterium]MCL4224599.1 hypothetical protein [Myxococcales bacterium]